MVCPSGVKAIGSNMPGLVSTVPPAVKLPWVLRTIGLPSSALLGSFSSALTGMEKIDAAVAASTTLVRAGLNPRSGAFFARTLSSCFMFSSRKRIAIGRSSCSGPERRQLLEARRPPVDSATAPLPARRSRQPCGRPPAEIGLEIAGYRSYLQMINQPAGPYGLDDYWWPGVVDDRTDVTDMRRQISSLVTAATLLSLQNP